VAAVARDPACRVLGAIGLKWGRGRILKDVRRSAAGLVKLAGGPGDRISCNDPGVRAVAYSVPVWQIVHN
jgi:hypothetical protein